MVNGKQKQQQKKQPRVIVFSTPTCTYCNLAKKYFRQNKVRILLANLQRLRRAKKWIKFRQLQRKITTEQEAENVAQAEPN